MAADEVLVQEIEPGRSTVTIDGWQVPGVRGVTVHKRVHNRDTVLIEVQASRVTVLPQGRHQLDVDLDGGPR